MVAAENTTDSIDLGYPSPDREWFAKDIVAFQNALQDHPSSLPNGERYADLFAKLIEGEYLGYLSDHQIPLNTRIEDSITILHAFNEILVKYWTDLQSEPTLEDELARITAVLLDATGNAMNRVDEFLPTIPQDETYETRLAGLKQMKEGMTTVLDGAIDMVADKKSLSDNSRIIVLIAVARNYPILKNSVPMSTRKEFLRRLKELPGIDSDEYIQALKTLTDDML